MDLNDGKFDLRELDEICALTSAHIAKSSKEVVDKTEKTVEELKAITEHLKQLIDHCNLVNSNNTEE